MPSYCKPNDGLILSTVFFFLLSVRKWITAPLIRHFLSSTPHLSSPLSPCLLNLRPFFSLLVPPSSALTPSLLLLCHHQNIWLTYVRAFTPCQLAGICTHADLHRRTLSHNLVSGSGVQKTKKAPHIPLTLLLTAFIHPCSRVCVIEDGRQAFQHYCKTASLMFSGVLLKSASDGGGKEKQWDHNSSTSSSGICAPKMTNVHLNTDSLMKLLFQLILRCWYDGFSSLNKKFK